MAFGVNIAQHSPALKVFHHLFFHEGDNSLRGRSLQIALGILFV
jgi:hypothetical protein